MAGLITQHRDFNRRPHIGSHDDRHWKKRFGRLTTVAAE
jgi:hypothetical protein